MVSPEPEAAEDSAASERSSPASAWRFLRYALVAALVLAGFYLGRQSGLGSAVELQQRNRDLARQVNQQAIELREARADNVRLAKSAEIDRLAAEDVRRELLTYRQETADLQRDLDFYRGLMAPDEMDRGLRIHSFSVERAGDSGRYNYKAIVTNAGGKGDVIKGQLKFSMVVATGDGNREMPFGELPEFQGSMPVKLRFRFFQNIQGSFKLPANYEPVSIHASANVKDRAGAYFKASYRWGSLVNQQSTGEG